MISSSCINCLGTKTIITYKPLWQITGIQRGRNVQDEGAKGVNKPEGESARHRGRIRQGRTSQAPRSKSQSHETIGAKSQDTGREHLALCPVKRVPAI